ncbi:hypothetical protein CTRI78_v010488 [Colletotrichum trifolii]|uniref:SRR1-like domain-containing protein n=1 Tax=Colletotrichum trifolii TaxID=5466 RepID=A0A4R8QQV0_COLTR|nr:hypothetical protein CTRI78_v010488 [Colletotrichum trifolii]
MPTTEDKATKEPQEEEWTFVKTKSRFRRAPPKVPSALKAKHDEPRVYKPAADIAGEYESFRVRWRETPCHGHIKQLIRSNVRKHKKVRRAVCLGVGTFDPEDGGWDAKRRSFIQLEGFLTVVEVLSELYNESIPCTLQEPRFTPGDVGFLTGLGHDVVESPSAFDAVDEDTLVFAIHMYRPIYEMALEKTLPAMFVGTGWDTWDGVGLLAEGDFKCMSDMHRSHTHFDFPQDGNHTTFSSTCLYWRPKSEDVLREQGDETGVTDRSGPEENTETVSKVGEECPGKKAESSPTRDSHTIEKGKVLADEKSAGGGDKMAKARNEDGKAS